jgi:hypothetical protein
MGSQIFLKRGYMLWEDNACKTFAEMLAGKLYNPSRCAEPFLGRSGFCLTLLIF